MSSIELQKRVTDIRRAAAAPGELDVGTHEQLFRIYCEIDASLPAGDGDLGGLASVMAEAMSAAAELPAGSPREALFKLALWRWDAPGLDYRLGDLARHDAVTYAAFRDLAALFEEPGVLKPSDEELQSRATG